MAKFHFTTPIGISCKSRSRQVVSCKFCKIFRNKLFQKTYERIYLCCLTKVCFVILQFWSTFLHKHRDTTNENRKIYHENRKIAPLHRENYSQQNCPQENCLQENYPWKVTPQKSVHWSTALTPLWKTPRKIRKSPKKTVF